MADRRNVSRFFRGDEKLHGERTWLAKLKLRRTTPAEKTKGSEAGSG